MKSTTRQAVRSYTSIRGDMMQEVKKTNQNKTSIQCTNVFKNEGSIGDSLTFLWADVINALENTGSVAHNMLMQNHTHQRNEVR